MKPLYWHDNIPWQPMMVINAKSWRTRRIFNVPDAFAGKDPDPNKLRPGQYVDSPSGTWRYANLVLPAMTPTITWNGKMRGRAMFDGDVVIPLIYIKIGSRFSRWPYMSLTPGEFMSLQPGILLAEGLVVVAGLGLGHTLIEITQKKEVEGVILVEIDEELINWLLPRLGPYGRMQKVTTICGDAHLELPKLKADVGIIDIYKDYEGENLKDFQDLRKRCRGIKTMWGWGLAED